MSTGSGAPEPGPESSRPDEADEVERLMIRCLDLPEAERLAALERAALEHPEWAARIEKRLAALRRLGIDPTSPLAGEARFPERLGGFRLLRRLGGGGMGVVYLARQESLGREVALKLIRPEQLYFPGARARFQREVEAVARLKHPGIVPVYAYGEESGVPYFAMERIEGCTLADVLRALAGRAPESLGASDLREAIAAAAGETPQRSAGAERAFEGTWVQACLRLVRQVAEALEHAHRRGVLHRDLKPSNVVVTLDGRALLVDFGLASASGSDRVTRSGSQVGSLPYMPPEIWSDGTEALDARSDVYSLGVTLYELLTLRLPYSAPSAERLRVAIERGECTPVHATNRAVPWDAQTVCQTAMERDPARRYATAEALARDLGNVLELRPIAARRPSAFLRARRWVQRHPTIATAVALGLLAVLVAPTAAAIAARRSEAKIREQKDRAVAEADTSKAMVEYLSGLFESASPYDPNVRDLTARELIETGAARLGERFAGRPDVQARLRLHLGRMQMHLARCDVALPLLEGAAAWFRGESGADAEETIAAELEIVEALHALERLDEAETLGRDLLARLAPLGSAQASRIVQLHATLGALLGERGGYDEAIDTFEAVRADAAVWSAAPADMRASLLTTLGHYRLLTLAFDDAEAALRDALELAGARRADPACELELARAESHLALLLSNVRRDYAGAIELAEDALASFERLQGATSNDALNALGALATAHLQRGDLARAIELDRRILRTGRELGGRGSRGELGTLNALAEALVRAGDPEAVSVARESLGLALSLPDADDAVVAESSWSLGQALIEAGCDAEAIEALELALSRQRATGAPGLPRLTKILLALGLAHVRAGEPELARPLLEECRELREWFVGELDPGTAEADAALAACALAAGDLDQAEQALVKSHPTLAAAFGTGHRSTQAALRAWAELWEARGDASRAEPFRRLLDPSAPARR